MENNQIKDFYNSFKERQSHIGVNKRHEAILGHLVNYGLQPEHRVLEVGCGIGTMTGLIAQYVTKGSILANDLSDDSINEAKKTLKNFKNIEFFIGSILDFQGSSLFDSIVMADVIEHIPVEVHNDLFIKLGKILRPDGKIFINIPNPPYLEWCIQNIPDKLQIIDQPIHADILINNLESSNLHLSQLITYPVWVAEGDYRFIVLNKKRVFQNVNNYNKGSNSTKSTILGSIFKKK